MFQLCRFLGACFVILAGAFLVNSAVGATGDWPQFHGPGRDAKCAETDLLKEWPKGGPKLLWKLPGLGRGYSTISIAGGRLLTMGDRPATGGEAQVVIAFDLTTRKELWATRIGLPHSDGPRCTPTVDGDLVYAVGTEGDLACLEAATGKVVWKKSFATDFGGKIMSSWKFSESPLVDGDKLVCTPGGKDATMVALDKRTGELRWKCAIPNIGELGADGAGYASIVPADIDGVRQYIQHLGRGVVGVDANTGRFLWGYNRIGTVHANIPMAVVRGNCVFVTNAYSSGSALLKITRDGDHFKADELWFLGPKEFENHHGGVVLVGDCLYGGHGQNKGTPMCLDFATGKVRWKAKAPAGGSAAILYADGRLYFRYDSGRMILVEATPEAFRIKGSFEVPEKSGPGWPHPVIHDGKLYLRDNDTLMCYDIRSPRPRSLEVGDSVQEALDAEALSSVSYP